MTAQEITDILQQINGLAVQISSSVKRAYGVARMGDIPEGDHLLQAWRHLNAATEELQKERKTHGGGRIE